MSKRKTIRNRVTPALWVALPEATLTALKQLGNQTGLTPEEVATLLVEPNPGVKFQAIRDSLHQAWQNRCADLVWRNSPDNLDWLEKHARPQAISSQP